MRCPSRVVLGSLLFLILVNEKISHANVYKYVDDMTRLHTNQSNVTSCYEVLNQVTEWVSSNNMLVNTMKFRLKKLTDCDSDLKLGKDYLKRAIELNFLGVISNDLK